VDAVSRQADAVAFEEGLRSAVGELADVGPAWDRTARAVATLVEMVDMDTPAWFRGAAWNQLERLLDDVVGALDWDAISPDAKLTPTLAEHLRTRSVNEVQAVAAAIAQLSIDLLRLGAARRALESGLLPP
jgi:hypothetical protein